MCICKFCESEKVVKNGFANGKQKYKCKACKRCFVEGDERKKDRTLYVAWAFMLYAKCGVSFNLIGKVLGFSDVTIARWLKDLGERYPKDNLQVIESREEEIELEVNEMWHFIQKKSPNVGYLKQSIEEQKNALRMLQDKETLRQLLSSMKNLTS
jgi:transposase-like protein